MVTKRRRLLLFFALQSGLLFPNCRTINCSISSFCSFFCNFLSPWPFHGPVHSPCRAMTTRTQLSWLPPLFTKATDTRYAEARSPLLFGEVLTKASAVFPLEHKRPAAFDLQVYRSDWHSCLEFVDFPIFHNLKGCLKNLIYLFVSRHEVHSMNTHTLQNAGW